MIILIKTNNDNINKNNIKKTSILYLGVKTRHEMLE